MYSKSIGSVPFYFFNTLDHYPGLLHFVSARQGGASEGEWSAMNLSLRVNDNPLNVKKNRELLAHSFHIDPRKMIFSAQTHEDHIAEIDSGFLGQPEEAQNASLQGIDAMVTKEKDVCLCILTADCASILLYDPVVNAIGIAHAGWRGTVNRIAGKTLMKLKEVYGSNPENVVVAIGPCISGESYETGEDVAEIFESTFPGKNGIVVRRPEWPKPHVDIVAANLRVLAESGLKAENIEISGICTFENPDIFFSARRNAGGRFAAGLMLR